MRILVAGAGPGGSLAAVLLARGGHEVLLVDRSDFPRDKACGDVVGPRALTVLAQVGIELPGDAHRIGSMVLGYKGRQITLPARPGLGHKGYGITMRRRDFDDLLHQRALDEGARSVTGVVSKIARSGKRLRASIGDGIEEFDVVVGADGANSTVAKSMGLVDSERVLLGFALRRHVRGTTLADRVDLFLDPGDDAVPGYGWVFDQGDGRLNLGVGVGVGADRARAKGVRSRLDAYQDQLVSSGAITVMGEPSEMGGWLKMGLVGGRVATDGVYLVGDAAGLVNPLQGEGIAAALASAVLCASVVIRHGADGAAIYRGEIDAHFSAFLSTGYLAQHLALSHPLAARLAMSGLIRVGMSSRVASAWGLFWNDLTEYSGPQPGSLAASLALTIGKRIAGPVVGVASWSR